jgi:type III secretion protein L
MVIWLRNPQAECAGLGVGVEDEVLRRERVATILDIDQGFALMQRQCEAALEAARADARALLDCAREQAAALRARADDDYATAEQRGFDAGFQRGLTDWHAQAARAHIDAATLERRARDRLAELVSLAVEQIVASSDPKALFVRAAAMIERIVEDGSPIHLRVHPSDVAAANEAFQSVALAWREAGRSVRLHVGADATLAPGACIAETDIGAIDASLSHHLAAVRGALARAVQTMTGGVFADADADDGRASDEAGDACPVDADRVHAPDGDARTTEQNDLERLDKSIYRSEASVEAQVTAGDEAQHDTVGRAVEFNAAA